MYIALVSIILLLSFFLAIVVLAQNPKGGGLSSQFGASGAANLMGVKRTGDLLEKMTWGLAIGVLLFSLGTHMLGQGSAGPVKSVNQQAAQRNVMPTAPAGPATMPPATAPAGTPTPAK